MNKEMIKIGDILTGKISFNIGGSAYLTSSELPKDIYINKINTNKALHLDTVNIKVIQGNGRALEGEVIEIVQRFKEEFVGVIQVSPRYAFFVPDSNKMSIDLFIPLSKTLGANDGQKVVARLTEWKDDAKNPNGEIVRVLGNAGEHETEIHSIMESYCLPYVFPEDVLIEAEAISSEIHQSEIDKRKDMRDIITFTIDGEHSRDFDDALSVDIIDGNLQVGVHIADVTHYIKPETELYKEAYNRGTSVYLVDRCVPMFPERLSNGICSLNPHEDKLCFSAIFTIDTNGNIIDKWFGRTVINSNHRFTYDQAQAIIKSLDKPINEIGKTLVDDGGLDMDFRRAHEFAFAILTLDRTAKKLRANRSNDNFLSIEKQEINFKLDENNNPIGVYLKTNQDSNKLIEEFMLLANKEVAKLIKSKGYPCVNRVHEKPNEEKLQSLKNFVEIFGYEVNFDDEDKIKSSLNKLLIDSKDSPESDIISTLVTRVQQKAYYSIKDLGHYGLGFKDYSHFTSPIRRFSDVKTHQLLALVLGNNGYPNVIEEKSKTLPNTNKLEAQCTYISEMERRAQKASRDSIKFMQCKFMEDKVGKVYTGVVSSIQEYGVFVTIPENNCEGLIKLVEIGGDTWTADTNNHCILGFNTGEKIRLGDEIKVVIKSVDTEKKNINLTLIRL